MRLSDVIFATSGGLVEWAAEHSDADVIQVTNGVDIGRFAWPVADKRGAVFVGTPAPWQGLDHLIKAANSPEWPTGLPLTVIGVSADDYSGQVSGPVHFVGRLSPVEVADILTASAIGISPKRLDQATIMGVSPFKLAEYHGAGLAVLASDVPGQSDMLQASGGGILFDPEDPESLVAAVRQLHESPNLLQIMQANARAYAERALTWRAQRSRIVDAIRASR